MYPASLCLFAQNTKCFLFQEDELMKYKRNTTWNAVKTENMTLTFNFYRPVNFQAITQLRTKEVSGCNSFKINLCTPLQGKGSLDSFRALQPNSLPSVPDSHSNKTITFVGDIFNFIRQIKRVERLKGGGVAGDKYP